MAIPEPPARPRSTLLFDADDTLWQNNVHFEKAIADFIEYLDHPVHTVAEVREHLNACERDTIREFGYGLGSFRRSLSRCYEQLAKSPIADEHHERIGRCVASIADAEIELLPGVAGTLPALAQRHRCLLVTKGDESEQLAKLERSGLRACFAGVEVLAEKHTQAYLDLVARHGCEPATTWMIGNSPKSDINPALAAGLNAVFLPHDFTWVLEHEVVDTPEERRRLMTLGTFRDLAEYF